MFKSEEEEVGGRPMHASVLRFARITFTTDPLTNFVKFSRVFLAKFLVLPLQDLG